MRAARRYSKASSLEEAMALKRDDPEAAWLAGGTLLLAGDGRDKSESVIDLGAALPRGLTRGNDRLTIGAGTTFQEIAESKDAPGFLVEAALSMANRNTRNRATLGGNIGADKSCSSLLPILLALGAEVEVASPQAPARTMPLEAWLRARECSPAEVQAEAQAEACASDLLLRAILPLRPGIRAAYRRWNRSSCDLSVLGAAAAYALVDGKVSGLRLALGGLGPKARRFPAIEALFEGSALPSREGIEEMAAPLLHPIDDLRAGAAFKRLRGSQLIADALREAQP